MKNLKLIFIIASLLSAQAFAGKVNLKKDIDSLGEDQAVVERAKQLDPKNKVQVVQNRAVDRNSRFEIGVDYGLVGGGDSYLKSQNFGGNLDFHITPRWSVGLRYNSYINTLTSEGQQVYATALAQQNLGRGGVQTPSIDSPVDSELLVVDWYPIYGKLNLFDWIPHFDIYTLIGYGKTTTLINGMSDTYAAGGGVGLWLTNFLAWRIEARYETYQDKPYNDVRRVDSVIAQTSLGLLL
jgi:outer membrane immunogenic protein